MNRKTCVSPTSLKWLSEDDKCIAGYFRNLGFRSLQDILAMRVFDLMNMNRLSAVRVEEIITCLYRYLNSNVAEDLAMYEGLMPQTFSYSEWRKKHKDLSDVTVGDLVFSEGINLKAIQHFYDGIRKKFFRSEEYDPREYQYYDYSEYLEELKKRGEVAGHDK